MLKKDIYKMTWKKLEKEITRLDKLDKEYWRKEELKNSFMHTLCIVYATFIIHLCMTLCIKW